MVGRDSWLWDLNPYQLWMESFGNFLLHLKDKYFASLSILCSKFLNSHLDDMAKHSVEK